jgi:hypothetical protein
LLALLVSLSIVESQELKLRVASPDSVLSRFNQCGFAAGTVVVEGTYVPLQGASVTLSDQPVDSTSDSSGLIITHLTDTSGAFSFNLIDEGQYYLQVEYPGYFPHTESVWIGSQDLVAVHVEMIPDYSQPSAHRTGSMQFEISDRFTGEPIDNAVIDLKELNELVEADLSGIRYLHLLKPGRYHFSVTADGYRGSAEDSALVAAGSCTPVSVELRRSDVTLADRFCPEDHRKPYPVSMIDPVSFCTLTGSLIDADDGKPIPFEQVYLAPYDMVTDTDSTGTFTFLGLRPGVYCVTARITGYHRTTEHGVALAYGKTTHVRLLLRRLPNTGD